jgi:predicted nucleotidyltransferase
MEKNLNISRIILFGSQARGKACAESDVDIGSALGKDFGLWGQAYTF